VVRLIGPGVACTEAETTACRAAGIVVERIPDITQAASNNDFSVGIARESGRSSNQ
jgi:hypothetical protein